MADRESGKASYLTINSVQIPITKTTPKVDRKCADTTDSGDYQSTQDMLFPTQVPVSVGTEIAVEGRFRKSSTPAAIIAQLYTSATNIPCVLGIDSGTIWGHGNVDITDYQQDNPVDDVITFTCTLKSNGVWTPNA
jgi:hypothetical protein